MKYVQFVLDWLETRFTHNAPDTEKIAKIKTVTQELIRPCCEATKAARVVLEFNSMCSLLQKAVALLKKQN